MSVEGNDHPIPVSVRVSSPHLWGGGDPTYLPAELKHMQRQGCKIGKSSPTHMITAIPHVSSVMRGGDRHHSDV